MTGGLGGAFRSLCVCLNEWCVTSAHTLPHRIRGVWRFVLAATLALILVAWARQLVSTVSVLPQIDRVWHVPRLSYLLALLVLLPCLGWRSRLFVRPGLGFRWVDSSSVETCSERVWGVRNSQCRAEPYGDDGSLV